MPLKVVRAIVCLPLLFASSCARAEVLDRFSMSEYTLDFEARLRKAVTAPVIVQGELVRVDEIGQPRLSRGDQRIAVQLVQITIKPEIVIKGELPQQPISFYFYRYSNTHSPVELRMYRYLPQAGQRRIFFLEREGGVLRSVGDVADYTLRIVGEQPSGSICKSTTVGCCIGRLMMTPGKISNPVSFASNLTTSVAVAELLCSRSEARSMVMALAESSYPDIAREAREIVNADGAP